ncbi:MAG TPA: type II CAAX endopeptidase family protein [Bacteroidia bacterium]|nr:type II CAAX endopeptidase family protein [Bacteroidia bacterium]
MTKENKFKWLGLFIALVVPAILIGMSIALSLATLYEEQLSNFPSYLSRFGWWSLSYYELWLAFFLFIIIRLGEKEPFSSLGSLKMNSDTLGLSAIIIISLIGAGMLLIVIWKYVFQMQIGHELAGERMAQLPLWRKAFLSLGAGITEEIIYRGYSITRLQQLTKNKPVSIIIPLAAFAFAHIGYGTVLHVMTALAMGIVLTIFYLKYKNLLANMIGHALFDFLFLALAR